MMQADGVFPHEHYLPENIEMCLSGKTNNPIFTIQLTIET